MRSLAAVVLAFCVAALAGCGGSGSSAPSRSPSPTGVPTAVSSSSSVPVSSASEPQTGPLLTGAGVSPGEKPPVRTDQSKEHTADGALEFGAYFYRAVDWGIATTNSYLVKQISAPTCDGCNGYIKTIDDLAARHGYSTGGRLTLTSIGFGRTDSPIKADYTIRAEVSQTTQVVVKSAGAAPSTYPKDPTPRTLILLVSWGPTGWQAVGAGHA